MSYTYTPTRWDNQGVEPSESLKTNGFVAGYKPPAGVFNKIISNHTNCISELQTEVEDKVDKVTGKQLSTEDYTTAEKTKLSGIEAGANNYSLPIASTSVLGGFKVGNTLTITSDGTLNAGGGTWGTITGTLSNQTDLQNALNNKVNVVSGKGLSTNDYTTAEKTKLANINTTITTGALSAGSTSITLSNSAITTNSILSFYTSVFGVSPETVTVASGSVTLTFEAQSSAITVGVRVDG